MLSIITDVSQIWPMWESHFISPERMPQVTILSNSATAEGVQSRYLLQISCYQVHSIYHVTTIYPLNNRGFDRTMHSIEEYIFMIYDELMACWFSPDSSPGIWAFSLAFLCMFSGQPLRSFYNCMTVCFHWIHLHNLQYLIWFVLNVQVNTFSICEIAAGLCLLAFSVVPLFCLRGSFSLRFVSLFIRAKSIGLPLSC
jgi:hypothetical protein